MVLSLLVGQPALPPQLLDQRVVGGQQPQIAFAVDVRAAVADVGDADLVVLDHGRGQRRPHPGARRVALGDAVDAPVRGLGDRPQVRLAGSSPRTAGSNDSAAIRDATSPACAPPIPSATRTAASRRRTNPRWRCRWRPVSVRNACSTTRSNLRLRYLQLEPELRVADLDLVEVGELRLPLEHRLVQESAVGRVHVLDVVVGPARVDAGVDRRRTDPRSGRRPRRTAYREAAEEVKRSPAVDPAAADRDQEGVGRRRAPAGPTG